MVPEALSAIEMETRNDTQHLQSLNKRALVPNPACFKVHAARATHRTLSLALPVAAAPGQ